MAAQQNKQMTVAFPLFTEEHKGLCLFVCLFLFKYSCAEHKVCKVGSGAEYVQDCSCIQG